MENYMKVRKNPVFQLPAKMSILKVFEFSEIRKFFETEDIFT